MVAPFQVATSVGARLRTGTITQPVSESETGHLVKLLPGCNGRRDRYAVRRPRSEK